MLARYIILLARPDLSLHAVRFLLPFALTYLCESGFLSLFNIEPKQRLHLEGVKCDLQCALSKTYPDIEKPAISTSNSIKPGLQ